MRNSQRQIAIVIFVALTVLCCRFFLLQFKKQFLTTTHDAYCINKRCSKTNPFLFYQPVNINRAGQEELAALPRIGDKKANELLQYRASLGFFLATDEIFSLGSPIVGKDVAVVYAYCGL